jgi:hypothetical protein
MDLELIVVLCALAVLASFRLGYAQGRAKNRERLRRLERERDAGRAPVRGPEWQATPLPQGRLPPGKSPWANGPAGP